MDETNTKVAILEKIDPKNRLTAIENTIKEFQDAETALDRTKVDIENKFIMHDLKMKERNIVVWGIPQHNVWESRQESYELCYKFLFHEVLKIPTSKVINIEDAHRLMGRAFSTNNNKTSDNDFPVLYEERKVDIPNVPLKNSYPLIFRASTMVQHKLIMKAFWQNLSHYNHNNMHGYRIHVSERHLPKRMQGDRKELLPQYLQSKKNGEKPRWFVNREKAIYCFRTKSNTYEPIYTYTRDVQSGDGLIGT